MLAACVLDLLIGSDQCGAIVNARESLVQESCRRIASIVRQLGVRAVGEEISDHPTMQLAS